MTAQSVEPSRHILEVLVLTTAHRNRAWALAPVVGLFFRSRTPVLKAFHTPHIHPLRGSDSTLEQTPEVLYRFHIALP